MSGRPAVLAPVVAQAGSDLHALLLEEEQRVVVQDLDGGHGHIARVEPGADVAAEAGEHDLEPSEHQLLSHTPGAVGRMLERMGEDAFETLPSSWASCSKDRLPVRYLLCLDGGHSGHLRVVEWMEHLSINLSEAGLATVPFGGHLSGNYRSTTGSSLTTE